MGISQMRTCLVLIALGLLCAVQAGCGTKPPTRKSIEDEFRAATKIPDARRRADRLLKIAGQPEDGNQSEQVVKSVAAAILAAGKIEDIYQRCRILNKAIYLYHSIGYGHRIDDPVRDVVGMVEQIEDLGNRIQISAQLGEIYTKFLNKGSTAEMYLADCEKWAGEIASLEGSIRALMVTAYYYHRLKQEEDCERLVELALEKAATVKDTRGQADLYGELGTRLIRLERKERAADMFELAERGAHTVGENLSRGYALLDLAARLKASGDGKGSTRLLNEAEKAAEADAEGALRRELLEKIHAAR
jgi:tetratricopeptide (TPR) repeat protein